MQDGRTTLTRFIIGEQRHVAGATGDGTGLLNDIATACKVIGSNNGAGRKDRYHGELRSAAW